MMKPDLKKEKGEGDREKLRIFTEEVGGGRTAPVHHWILLWNLADAYVIRADN